MWIIDPSDLDKREWLPVQEGAIKIAIEFDFSEPGYKDNIKMAFTEDCPPEFAFFKADESSFGLTSAEARKLAQWLNEAADQNDQWLERNQPKP